MIEHLIRAATCRICCGDESGTGWLIAQDRVITARHCVLAGLDHGRSIELYLPEKGDIAVTAKVIAQSEENDVCLLSTEVDIAAEALPVGLHRPREGETWQTFGYSKGKASLGHRLTGEVAQVLDSPKLKIDLDLSIDSTTGLQTYQGLSGAVVVCDGAAIGLIRLKVDGTVGALSLCHLADFLVDHGVSLRKNSPSSAAPLLADRGNYSQVIAHAVHARAGSYLFLEGAHGYGKSTFCSNFRSDDKTLINLGAYCLSEPTSALGAEYRAQPQVFLDWLMTAISVLVTGHPPRKEDRTY